MSRFSRLLPRFLRSDKEKSNYSKDVHYFSDRTFKDGSVCKILFLDDTEITLSCKGSCKGASLLDKVYQHLNILEQDYFGLRYLDQTDQTHWLESQKTVSSQLKTCAIPYTLYFGVKFYPADPCKLREEITRYQFYLQVKKDVLQGRLPLSFEEAAELFAYGIQSELGDFDPKRLPEGYVSEFRFVPNQTEVLEDTISSYHRRLIGLASADAEFKFLDKVKWLDMYGVDLHPVLGEANTEYFLGLTPTGIVVYKNKTKVGNYFWPRITKVTFKGKIFIIKVRDRINDEHTYAFELCTKAACKHLWKCCIEHHAFFRLNHETDYARSEKSFRSVNSSRRSSGRQDRMNQSEYGREQPDVLRVPMRRHPKRTSSDSGLHSRMDGIQYMVNDRPVTMVAPPEPVRGWTSWKDRNYYRRPRHTSLPDLNGKGSPRSTRSAPWNTNADTGMYTSGRDSPTSMYSDNSKFPNRRGGGGGGGGAGSDTESGYRRKYFPNRSKGSDNESDVSFSRRRRREADSGSESDISPNPRNRRPKSSADHWFESQWRDAMSGMHIPNKEKQMNGSIPSIHSAPAGEVAKRRRRRRTKSPSSSKQPPAELKEHIQYGLVDPGAKTEEELKEIPYTKVETKAEPFKIKYSPKTRQRYRSPKRKSFGDLEQPNKLSGVVVDEPPPPYTPQGSATATPEMDHRKYFSDTNSYYKNDRNIEASMFRKDTSGKANGTIKMKEEIPHDTNSIQGQGLSYRMDNTRTSNRSYTQRDDSSQRNDSAPYSNRSTLQDNEQAEQTNTDDLPEGHTLSSSVVANSDGGDLDECEDIDGRFLDSNENDSGNNRQQKQVFPSLNHNVRNENAKNLHISHGKGTENPYSSSAHTNSSDNQIVYQENFNNLDRTPTKNAQNTEMTDLNITSNINVFHQNRTPVGSAHSQNRTPVSSAHSQNRTPVGSAHSQNRTPVSSAHSQNRTPVGSAHGQNRTPVDGAHTQNRTPISSAHSLNRALGSGVYNQNRTPADGTDSQNRAHVGAYNQSRNPVNSAHTQNRTPISSANANSPKRTPVKGSYDLDKTPVKNYDPERTPVKNLFNTDRTPVKSSYDQDRTPVKYNRDMVSGTHIQGRTPEKSDVNKMSPHGYSGQGIKNSPYFDSKERHYQDKQVPHHSNRNGPATLDRSPYQGSNVQSVSVSTNRTFTTQDNIRKLYSSPHDKKAVYATQDSIRRLYNLGPEQTTPTKQDLSIRTFHSTPPQNSVQPHSHHQNSSTRKPYQHPHLQASQGPGEISVNRGLTRNVIDSSVIHPTLSTPPYRRDLWTEI